MSAIETNDLTCRFGALVAVDRLSIAVEPGEVFGVLGHNGAGKTTTVRLLNGLLAPSAGSVRVLGRDPRLEGSEVRRHTGVLTETPALDERLTARENLTFFAAFYDLHAAAARARVAELLAEFDLADRADERVGGYSKGMKQRLALARLLLHDPELLFLDEPTAGLDPAATRSLHALIRTASRERGRTVFLCTHNLHEAELLCDRVAVLAHGRVLAIGAPAELTRRFAPALDVRLEVDPAQGAEAEAALVARLGTITIERDGGMLTLAALSRERIPDAVQALASANVRVFRVEPRAPTLEDVYFALQLTDVAAERAA